MSCSTKAEHLLKFVGAGAVALGCVLAARKLPRLREGCARIAYDSVSCNRFDLWWWFLSLEVFIVLSLAIVEILGLGAKGRLSGPGLLAVGVTVGQDTANYLARETRLIGHGDAAAGFALMTAGNLLLIVALGYQRWSLSSSLGAGSQGYPNRLGAGQDGSYSKWATRCTLFVAVMGLVGWILALGGAQQLCSAWMWECSRFGLLWWVLSVEFLVLLVVFWTALSRILASWLSAVVALLAAPVGHLALYAHSFATYFSAQESRVAFLGAMLMVVLNLILIICAALQSGRAFRRFRYAHNRTLVVFRITLLAVGCVGWVMAMVGVHTGFQRWCTYFDDYSLDSANCDYFNYFWWRFALEGLILLGVAFSLLIDFPEECHVALVGLLAVASPHPMFFADQFRHYAASGGGLADVVGMYGYITLSISFLGLILNMGWVRDERSEGLRGFSLRRAMGYRQGPNPRGALREPLLFSVFLNGNSSPSVTDNDESLDSEEDESTELDMEEYERNSSTLSCYA